MDHPETCRLCGNLGTAPLARAGGRVFSSCPTCGLIQADSAFLPGPEDEKRHHLANAGQIQNPAYQANVLRLLQALRKRADTSETWLDFGCGPGRTLQNAALRHGLSMEAHDPLFAPAPSLLEQTYACIGCSEAAEHFHRPGEAFNRLQNLLRPGGWLGIQTLVLHNPDRLADWPYARDFTHVCFYQPRTFLHLAEHHKWELEMPDPNIALFHKPADPVNPGNC